MSSERFDLVIYGASGYTGKFIVKRFVESKYFEKYSFAVAGRNKNKLQTVLDEVSAETGKDIKETKIIFAQSGDDASLGDMAKQAKVLISAVGPYRLYGEEIVRNAVENKASYVDISGEPNFLEKMVATYGEKAKENGIYIIGAAGWDSIPCDLGFNYLKKHYNGDIAYVESFVQPINGPAGYTINDGTYQTLILGLANATKDKLGEIRRQIMPNRPPKSEHKLPTRMPLFYNPDVQLWCLPFKGADKSVVVRSQYDNFAKNNETPIPFETFFGIKSGLWAFLTALYFTFFAVFCQFSFTRQFLQENTDMVTFGLFSKNGPTKEQVDGARFIYWFVGKAFDEKDKTRDSSERPTKTVVAKCEGPDMGYIATAGCVLSAALTILEDREHLPMDGGAYTTATAFGESKMYDILEEFGVTFKIES